jgi:hypothetical protein
MKKEELKKYLRRLNKRAATFKLSGTDISNLYDLMNMADTPDNIRISMRRTLKMNRMDKWFYSFMDRLENVVLETKGFE